MLKEDHTPRVKKSKAFEDAYLRLNSEQRNAVELIEGPVMVVAGPGTGKTQILALRIAQILTSTDSTPQNILCLTYTDAGAIAMRQRLLEFIGPEAYKVQTHTFHSFCNQVIQDHQELFLAYTDLLHISELEKAVMFAGLIESLPYENPLRRLKGAVYQDVKKLEALFSTIKREFWTEEMILDKIAEDKLKVDQDRNNTQYFYTTNSRSGRKGEPKKKYHDFHRNMALLEEAVRQFGPFQEKMRQAGRYDFDDMIHWVVKLFREDESLLASYQERFQYLLIDEYQDTNGSQNEIIHLLAGYWDRPNLFVVGDEDQAIFRFQGANINNLRQLVNRYDPVCIYLRKNYRSSQPLLDSSFALIQKNHDSFSTDRVRKEKLISATSSINSRYPSIFEFPNIGQEETFIFESLKRLKEEGETLSEIAVIYRRHVQATNLIKALTLSNIPIDVKHRVNILEDPLIINLNDIFTFLVLEQENPASNDSLLFKIMHYRFFGLDPVDLAKLSQHCWRDPRHPIPLRFILKEPDLLDHLNLTNIQGLILFSQLLDVWLQRIPHVTVEVFLEYLLKEGQILKDIMTGEMRVYRMQVLATFFNYLKAESQRTPGLELRQFVDTIHQMKEIGLSLPMQSLTKNREGISFLTAHGAKGLEFKHVFILGANRKNWESLRGSNRGFDLPSGLKDPGQESDVQDERRLFYVAMTRAKENLTITFSSENLNGMADEPSQFISEIMEVNSDLLSEKISEPEATIGYYHQLLQVKNATLPLLDHDLIDKKLERFELSPSALNVFLRCPRSFYFEYILGVPKANNPYLGFGNAVHRALHDWINRLKNHLGPDPAEIIGIYQKAMEQFQSYFTRKQYGDYLEFGKKTLPSYIQSQQENWKTATEIHTEKGFDHLSHREVPITGRVDLILKSADGYCSLVDFKTGNPELPATKDKLKGAKHFSETGGDYWRQMVFYKILLEELRDPALVMKDGYMSFIEPDKYDYYLHEHYLVSEGERDMVSDQISNSYRRMQNHDFDITCEKQDCLWCSFVKNDYIMAPEITAAPEEDDRSYLFSNEAVQLHFEF